MMEFLNSYLLVTEPNNNINERENKAKQMLKVKAFFYIMC